MSKRIRMIGHEDQLSLVDHLEELRSRIVVCLITFGVVFAVCFWQNHTLLKVINAPLSQQTKKQVAEGKGPLGGTWLAQQAARRVARTDEGLVALLAGSESNLPPKLKA